MEKLEEGIGDSVRPKNKFESCKTSNDVGNCQIKLQIGVPKFSILKLE